jgi:hypothetical protein
MANEASRGEYGCSKICANVQSSVNDLYLAAAAAADQAFSIIRDGAYKLAASQKVTLGVVEPPVGNAGEFTTVIEVTLLQGSG